MTLAEGGGSGKEVRDSDPRHPGGAL